MDGAGNVYVAGDARRLGRARRLRLKLSPSGATLAAPWDGPATTTTRSQLEPRDGAYVAVDTSARRREADLRCQVRHAGHRRWTRVGRRRHGDNVAASPATTRTRLRSGQQLAARRRIERARCWTEEQDAGWRAPSSTPATHVATRDHVRESGRERRSLDASPPLVPQAAQPALECRRQAFCVASSRQLAAAGLDGAHLAELVRAPDDEPHCEQCCSSLPEPASTPGSSVEPGVW